MQKITPNDLSTWRDNGHGKPMGSMDKRPNVAERSWCEGGFAMGRSVQNYEKLLSSKDENVQRKITELKLQVAELMQQLADEQRLVQTVRHPEAPCPTLLGSSG